MRNAFALLAALTVVASTWSCGDDSSTSPPGDDTGAGSPTGGTGGTTSSGTGGTTSSGTGGTTSSGTGGSGGGTAENGVQASDLVNAGSQAASDNYKLTHTMGQPTQNQGMMTSPSYRMQGGLIGAMGTLP